MSPAEILEKLKQLEPYAELALDENQPAPILRVAVESIQSISDKLKRDPSLAFDCLMCLSGIDKKDAFEVLYDLYSMKHGHHLSMRVVLPHENPTIPTVCKIWPAAEWHEREAFDMFGIVFNGHPDPRRILCPDDWDGHPLRKDYKPPEEFHGIPLTSQFPPERAS